MNVDDDTPWDFGTTHNGKRMSDLPAQYLLWYWEIRGWMKDDKYHDYIHSAFNDLCREAKGYIEYKAKNGIDFPNRDINGKEV